MTFDSPLVLFLAPVLAVAFGCAAWLARRRRVQLARRWSPSLARIARARGGWAPAVIGVAVLLAGIGLAGPRSGRTEVKTETRALSLVFAMDISRSMLAEDVAPSRLLRASREARRLIQDLEGDRLGMIAFAGRSYILAPLTVDGGAIRMYLDALDPDLASEGGTSLAAVLTQGAQLLGAATDAADRVLVLFTDGEAHDTLPEAIAAAETLKDEGVRLIVVAQGRALPTRIPLRDSAGTLLEYKQDEAGNVVRTQRRDDVLRAVVEAAEGTLVPSELPDQAGAVRDVVAAMKRSPTSDTRTNDLVPRAWIPVLAAGIMLLGYTIARPGPALVSFAGLLLLSNSAAAQRPTTGYRAMDAGDPAGAAAEFLKEAQGSARDTAFYNAGTAALDAQRFEIAQGALTEAAKSLDPDLRYRALYNLGVAGLLAAAADTAKRNEHLDQAAERLREALLLQPSSARAKWNLELTLRRQPPPSGGGGGGGGKPPAGGGGGGSQSPEPARPEPQDQELSRSQAEQILNSMERRERETRSDQQRRLKGSSGGGVKDW
ncbi:MAG TPA: VWA domain-containing protein [Gemmatimonadales bacterium]|nr:VWA domain-containing protein [Gemmatimonadales bacterium]